MASTWGLSWGTSWGVSWDRVYVAPTVEPKRPGGRAVRKRYLIRGKFYLLTDDELAVLIGHELADISRRDVKVAAPKAKPRVISAEAWAAVKPLARLEALAERMEEDDGDDEDELILMMV